MKIGCCRIVENATNIHPEGALKPIQELINEATWTNPKADFMPEHPHQYIVKKNYPVLFARLEELIEREGYWDYFYTTKRKYLEIDNHRYWCMPPIINRCLTSYKQPRGIKS